MPQQWPEILTPNQVAEYLQMELDEVMALLSSSQMPGSFVAGKWRIRKARLDEWIDTPTDQGNTGNQPERIHRDTSGESSRKLTPVVPPKKLAQVTPEDPENTKRGDRYVAKKVKLISEKTDTVVSVTPAPQNVRTPFQPPPSFPTEEGDTIICTQGHQNQGGNRFCTHCGEALKLSPIVASDNLSLPQPKSSPRIKGTLSRFPLTHKKYQYIYGFITAQDDRTVYVKASDIENNEQLLKEGDWVEFDIVGVSQGWEAKKVTLLSQKAVTNLPITPPRQVKIEPVSSSPARLYKDPRTGGSQMATRITGVIKTFSSTTGYGFITAEDGRDVYVNSRDVEAWGQSLRVKDQVEFEIVSVPRGTGWAAKEVTILSAKTESIISPPPDTQEYRQTAYPEVGRLYKEALAARDQGDIKRARELFEEAIHSEPHQRTFLAYAAAEKNAGKFPKALQIYKTGIEALPEDGILYEQYAMLLRQRNKLADAADILRKGLREAPHFARQLHWALAAVLVDMDDDVSFQEAAVHAQEAKKLGMNKGTMAAHIRYKLEFVTDHILGRKTWDFFKAADFEIRVQKCTQEYAEILVSSMQPE
ncbi:cold shock domain-containing protein [Limnofasciculus baicalensis]|uniref:Cold shock domain-containing protein n=1 Tax=Limnofasciculus baicalensis BBK-W-15 TaxID=2699891 RepID=A0AAE3GRZ7_9CYAN|nr:cold shock domain-containing protein [Limnofasciculus baicalensis]MCP2728871.1 cold shock domain-containing protein [Limnofasciculus baicalensis BBK-W-15]